MLLPDLPIIDAHQHFWDLEANYLPWLRDEPPIAFRYGDYSALRRNYLTDDYRRDTQGLNLIGSSMYQTSHQTSDINRSTAPHFMAKLGLDYTWDWGSASVFYNYFSKPPRLPTEVVVNPEPQASNLLTLNLQFDVSPLMNLKKKQAMVTFRVENLLNEKVNVPEFNRGGNPNSLPNGPGTTFFGGLKVDF